MRFINLAIGIISLILFSSVYISPEYFSYVGLLPFFIPLAWLLNLFLLGIGILSWRKSAWIPAIVLLIGYKFALITFQLNPKKEDPNTKLQVLTYNAHLFDYKRKLNGGDFDPNVFKWLQEHPADVKVFQEFYNDKTSSSRNAVKFLGEDVKYESSYQVIDGDANKRSYGLAIFSRYPIINEGKVFDNSKTNGAIFADIVIDQDTVRIYNSHLESMKINSEGLENIEGVKDNYRQTLGKLHRGSLARSRQLKVLLEHMRFSPHPIILMGDLNEVPYSYTYFKLSEDLTNAFETAGRGFGFTYNRILFFLRIDHIFSSPSIEAVDFKTHREVDYSDHYPVSASFTW
ncbi:endonuclease/exonuclease/phosphatase family protein [Algoriphagus namhaensis]